jgi:hypothetical protein
MLKEDGQRETICVAPNPLPTKGDVLKMWVISKVERANAAVFSRDKSR